MNLLKKCMLSLTIVLGLSSITASADIDESMQQMCSKIKSCGLIELENQGLAKEMQDMMIGMFDGMCATMFSKHMKTVGQAGLEDKAEACIDSMVEANCEELLSKEGKFRTEKCDEFEKAADAAGVKYE
jgi:hypothetical protein